VSFLEGDCVAGALVGDRVGFLEGAGALVGDRVGFLEGDCVVGTLVGDSEGSSVGEPVAKGACDGFELGESVAVVGEVVDGWPVEVGGGIAIGSLLGAFVATLLGAVVD
jgi:hypothetical protein